MLGTSSKYALAENTASGLFIEGGERLGDESPKDHPQKRDAPYKLYSETLKAGTAYVIEMSRTDNKTNLDPYLIVHDSKGETIAEDDNSGGDLNARIILRAQK